MYLSTGLDKDVWTSLSYARFRAALVTHELRGWLGYFKGWVKNRLYIWFLLPSCLAFGDRCVPTGVRKEWGGNVPAPSDSPFLFFRA